MTAGVGAKLYTIRGPGNPDQPLSDIATLTARNDPKLLVVGGSGQFTPIAGLSYVF